MRIILFIIIQMRRVGVVGMGSGRVRGGRGKIYTHNFTGHHLVLNLKILRLIVIIRRVY